MPYLRDGFGHNKCSLPAWANIDTDAPRICCQARLGTFGFATASSLSPLLQFLTGLRIDPCIVGGVTWLELLIIYEITLKKAYTPQPFWARQDNALTTAFLVTSFRKACLALVRDSLHPEVHSCFASPGKVSPRLACLGITSTLAATSMLVYADPPTINAVARIARSYRADFRPAMADSLGHGALSLRPCTVPLDVPPRWRNDWEPAPLPLAPRAAIQCPKCRARVELHATPLALPGGVWPKARCGACNAVFRTGGAKCLKCVNVMRRCACKYGHTVQQNNMAFFAPA